MPLSGKLLRTLEGHTGAIYDVAFSPDSRFLVSASADDTCKVWRVEDGQRMDTLPQPLKAEYACTFSPDGQTIVAAGADNNIRVWQFVSRDKPEINPMVIARFAHEGPIIRLAFTPDGSKLVSLAEDRTVKVWRTKDYSELRLWENQPDVPEALAFAGNGTILVGRLDGSLSSYAIPADEPVHHTEQAQAKALCHFGRRAGEARSGFRARAEQLAGAGERCSHSFPLRSRERSQARPPPASMPICTAFPPRPASSG